MKRKLLPFFMLISALLMLSSCLKSNDEDVTYYDDTAITAFTLGTLKQQVTTTSSDQTTTTSTTTIDCSGYAFYIDQARREIYNPDSLPYGVDASKVICTISSKNSGTVTIKSMTSDSLSYYSSTDSIDFSQPRQFTVYSNSGNYSRTYTIRVNVHQQRSGVFAWTGLNADAALGALEAMKAVTTADRIFVFGKRNGQTRIYSRSTTADGAFAEVTPNVSLAADAFRNVVVKGNTLYLLNGGQMLRSDDAATWIPMGTVSLKQLVGATDARLYATGLSAGLMSSADGLTWTAEQLSGDVTMLPTEDLNLCYLPSVTNPNTNQVVLVGNRTVADDATAMVWGKVEENSKGSENQPWGCFEVAADNKYPAPHLRNLQVVAYNGGLMAIGGAGLGKSQAKAFAQFYRSIDGGITWQNDTNCTLPGSFSSSETSFAMTVDHQQFIWIICGGSGQIWRARLSDLGWKKEQTAFTE